MILFAVAACGSRPSTGATSGDGAETGSSDTGTGESSTSTSTTSGTESEGDSDDTNFLPPSDHHVSMCDPWEEMDCPEGEKCTHYATMGAGWDASKCVPIQGDQQPGEPCLAMGEPVGKTGLDDCADGSMCWEVDPNTAMGHCIALCKNAVEDAHCPDGTVCEAYPSYAICAFECDPMQAGADCPNPDNLCLKYAGDDTFICRWNASDGEHPHGTPCMYANSCNHGLFCADTARVPGCSDPDADKCCTPFCDLDQPDTCPDQNLGVECVPWWEEPEMAPAEYAHVGGCLLP